MRKKRIGVREWIMASLFIAVGVILPVLLHSMGIAGQIFLPMHIPVLIAGFLLSPLLALVVGVVTPFLSSVLTGMPIVFPIAPIMMMELGIYGLLVSVLTRTLKWNTIQVLLVSMVMGRMAAGVAAFALIQVFGIKMNALLYVKGAVLTGLPGMTIQIVLIPFIVMKIKEYYKAENYQQQEV